jgi:predicted CopG family antitoxin
MNNSEKNFMAVSREVMEELVEKQNELASSSSISNETARRIASEIIEQLTEKKKKALEKNYGFQKAEKTEEVKKKETNNKK